jgi:hypothetical protein
MTIVLLIVDLVTGFQLLPPSPLPLVSFGLLSRDERTAELCDEIEVKTFVIGEPPPEPTLEELLKLLDGEIEDDRSFAARRLSRFDSLPESGIARLVRLAVAPPAPVPSRDDSGFLSASYECRATLLKLGKPAISLLAKALRDPETPSRGTIATLILDIAKKHGVSTIQDSQSSLTDYLAEQKRPYEPQFSTVLSRLAELKADAKFALPALEKLWAAEPDEGAKSYDLAKNICRIAGKDHPKAGPVMKRYDLNQRLVNAASDGDMKQVRSFLDAGADINAKGNLGIEFNGTFVTLDGSQCDWTALMRAAESGNMELAKFLLERGADVNVERNGKTALDYAERAGKRQVQNLLRSAGAKHGSARFPKPDPPASIVL